MRMEQLLFYLQHNIGEHMMGAHHEHHLHRFVGIIGQTECHVAALFGGSRIVGRIVRKRSGAHVVVVEIVSRIFVPVDDALCTHKTITQTFDRLL